MMFEQASNYIRTTFELPSNKLLRNQLIFMQKKTMDEVHGIEG
jgi:hypothetical protein